MCVRIKQLDAGVKKWMVDEMHALLISHNAPPIDVPAIMNCSRYRDPLVCKMRMEGNRHIKEVGSQLVSKFIYESRKNDRLYPSFICYLRELLLLNATLKY